METKEVKIRINTCLQMTSPLNDLTEEKNDKWIRENRNGNVEIAKTLQEAGCEAYPGRSKHFEKSYANNTTCLFCDVVGHLVRDCCKLII